MQTLVKLQELYNYSIIPLIVFLILVIFLTIYLFLLKKIKVNKALDNKKMKKIPEKNIRDLPVIKNKYLNKLDLIKQKYEDGNIELREAYQLISENIRLFVFEVTNITTQNYSLSEIKKLDMPILYELIKEYYEPEFASKPIGDFMASLEKARSVIDKWN